MTDFASIFNCNYPIAAMAMNKVSDLNLAIAVRRAGAFPSLSIYNYFRSPTTISAFALKEDLDKYAEVCGDACILVSIGVDQLLDDSIFKVVHDSRVSAIELILDTSFEANSVGLARDLERNRRVALLQENKTLVFVKAIHLGDIEVIPKINGISLKGPDGAGRGNDQGITLSELFDQVKEKFPHLKIIVAGGIGTPAQVKEYMDRGAFGVGVGTLFAAAEESKVAYETKLKMVSASSADIKKLSAGAQQNALVFKEIGDDNFNNTRGLMAGVQGTAMGHVFAGKSIEYVTGIRPVEKIVQDLVKDL